MAFEASQILPRFGDINKTIPTLHRIYAGLFFVFTQLLILFILGSSVSSLFVLFFIDLGGLFLLLHYGLSNANALLIVGAIAVHISLAAVIKMLIGQPLEENLLVPDTTFAIELIYFLALLAAFYLTQSVRLPNLFRKKVLDPDVLKNVAICTAVLSLSATVFYVAQSAEIGQEFGEINNSSSPLTVSVRGFGTLALVCCTARAVLLSNRAKLFDPLSFVIVAASVIVGLSTNSREGVAAPIIAVVLTGLAFGYRFRLTTAMTAIVFAIIFVNYISPALIITRAERDTLGPLERVTRTFDVTAELLLNPQGAEKYSQILNLSDEVRLGRYFGLYNTLADRVAMVQTVDLVADGIQRTNNLDYEELPNIFSTLLPENVFAMFGYERPAAVSVGDLIAWTAGISPYGFVSFLAIPEDAEAYAVGGLPAVAYRTFAVYLLSFAAFALLGGVDLRSNVLGISLFLMFLGPAGGGSSISLYYFWMRIAPQFAGSFFIIVALAGLFKRPAAPSGA